MRWILLMMIAVIPFCIFSQVEMEIAYLNSTTIPYQCEYYSLNPDDGLLHFYDLRVGADSINIYGFKVDVLCNVTGDSLLYTYHHPQDFALEGNGPYYARGDFRDGTAFLMLYNPQYIFVFAVDAAGVVTPHIINYPGVSAGWELRNQCFYVGNGRFFCYYNRNVYLLDLSDDTLSVFLTASPNSYAYDFVPLGEQYLLLHENRETLLSHDFLIDTQTQTYTTQNVMVRYSMFRSSPDIGDNTYIVEAGWYVDWDFYNQTFILQITNGTIATTDLSYYSSTGSMEPIIYVPGEHYADIVRTGHDMFICIVRDFHSIADSNTVALFQVDGQSVIPVIGMNELQSIDNPLKMTKVNDRFLISQPYTATGGFYFDLIDLQQEQVFQTTPTELLYSSCIISAGDNMFFNVMGYSTINNIQTYQIQPGTVNSDDIIPTPAVELTCYPNPFTDKVTFESKDSNSKSIHIDVFNTKGQKVKSLDTTNQTYEWDGLDDNGNSISEGVYLVRIQAGKSIGTKKVLRING